MWTQHTGPLMEKSLRLAKSGTAAVAGSAGRKWSVQCRKTTPDTAHQLFEDRDLIKKEDFSGQDPHGPSQSRCYLGGDGRGAVEAAHCVRVNPHSSRGARARVT
ncbi:hypothetical protein AOLI_G00199600 [Acnodon oligacanthus]